MKFDYRICLALVAAALFSTITMTAAEESKGGEFRHVVCFAFKADATPAEVKEIEKEFKALKGKIDAIVDFEWGRSENVEPLNDGFTHCFMVTFVDKAGLEEYLPHEDHEAFKALLIPKLEKVFVFDYTAKK